MRIVATIRMKLQAPFSKKSRGKSKRFKKCRLFITKHVIFFSIRSGRASLRFPISGGLMMVFHSRMALVSLWYVRNKDPDRQVHLFCLI